MSTRVLALREKMRGITSEQEGILSAAAAEARDITVDEKSRFDTLDADYKRAEEALAMEERVEARRIALAKPTNDGISAGTTRFAVPKSGRLPTHFKGPTAREDAYKAGVWLKAALFNDPEALTFCREHGIGINKALGIASNGAGGYLVPEEFAAAIIDNRDTHGIARRQCQVVPMDRDTITFPTVVTGLSATAGAENTAMNESQPTFGQARLTAGKWYVYVPYSTEIAEDAIISMADWLAGDTGLAFASAEDDALFNGDGSTTYHGVYGIRPKLIADSRTGAVQATSGDDTFAEVLGSDLDLVIGKLPQWAHDRGNAAWYCSMAAYSVVFAGIMRAAGGATIGEISAGVAPRYLGYPIYLSPKMPNGVATDYSDVIMLLFGDMRSSVLFGDRRDITLAVSEHVNFNKDQLVFRATERFDIVAHGLGDSTTAGGLVGLKGN